MTEVMNYIVFTNPTCFVGDMIEVENTHGPYKIEGRLLSVQYNKVEEYSIITVRDSQNGDVLTLVVTRGLHVRKV